MELLSKIKSSAKSILSLLQKQQNAEEEESCKKSFGSTNLSIDDHQHASQAFDQLYEKMKQNGELSGRQLNICKQFQFYDTFNPFCSEESGSAPGKNKAEDHLPPLEDPSIILTSPDFPKGKYNESIKSNESFDDPDSAREVLTQALNIQTPPNNAQSHFEELKQKQKQEQSKFHQRLIDELEIEKGKNNSSRKFLNADSVQDEPVPSHTYDPIHQSNPLPRKRHQSARR